MSDTKAEGEDALRSAIRERITHPFFGVLAIAVAIANWPFLTALIVGPDKGAERITLAQSQLNLCSGLLIPALISAIYVLVAPIVRGWAERYEAFILNKARAKKYVAKLKHDAERTREFLLRSQVFEGEFQAIAKKITEAEESRRQAEDQRRRSIEALDFLEHSRSLEHLMTIFNKRHTDLARVLTGERSKGELSAALEGLIRLRNRLDLVREFDERNRAEINRLVKVVSEYPTID